MDNQEMARAFRERHGEGICIEGGFFYYATGAMSEPHGARREPPADNYARCRIIVQFWQAKLDLAIQEFNGLRMKLMQYTKTVMSTAHCQPPPEPETLEELKALQKKVKECQASLTLAQDDVHNYLPDAQVRNEKMDAQNREDCGQFLTKLQSIEV